MCCEKHFHSPTGLPQTTKGLALYPTSPSGRVPLWPPSRPGNASLKVVIQLLPQPKLPVPTWRSSCHPSSGANSHQSLEGLQDSSCRAQDTGWGQAALL